MPPALADFLVTYGSNPFAAAWFIFGHGGALIFIPIMIQMALKGWVFWIQEKFKHHLPHTLYKIEVPQNNEQSMKAVEQIFVQIYGTHDVADWWQHWWQGYVQEEFAFEIVSDGGYITYYVRTPTYYKEIVQASFYAHYPDAILTEVEDYTKKFTVEMINEEKVKVWGSEMRLEADDVRPIKTYPMFEHQITGKAIDPMANILEFMSRMQPGETLWYQILLQPTELDHLKHRAEVAIMEIVEPGKAHGHTGKDIVDYVHQTVLKILDIVHNTLFGGEANVAEVHEEGLEERQRLTTPEREFVEEVDKKASRWPFHAKVRFMYFAAPKIYDGKKARRGMLGGLKLYRFINAFVEGAITRTDWGTLPFRYIRPNPRLIARARRMFWAYKSRDMERGEHEGFVLTTEEIASIFHFPQIEVRAPYVAKSQSRGVEPPTLLQYDTTDSALSGITVGMEHHDETLDAKLAPPETVVPDAMNSVRLEPELNAATPARPRQQAAVTLEPTTPESLDISGQPIEPEPPSNLPFV